jgi:hypothetical protein
MNATRFDRIAALLAERRLSRRQAIRQGGAGLAAGALAAAALRVSGAAAQDATPVAAPSRSESDPTFLFVQSFQSGSFAPKAGSDDTFTLTLAHGLGQTIYFSDRPERIAGSNPTAAFLARFPFGADNPPNAALVLEAGPGDTDVVVVELTAPAYDEATHTAAYEAKPLRDYEKLGITFQEEPKGAAELHGQFGAASLFIDDCPDGEVMCQDRFGGNVRSYGPVGYCYDWGRICCAPCDPAALVAQCYQDNPNACWQNSCTISILDEQYGC